MEQVKTCYGAESLTSPLFAHNSDPDGNPSGLEYYGISFINSTLQWRNELEHLKKTISVDVFLPFVKEAFKSSEAKFLMMKQAGIHLLNCSVFADIMPAIKTLYTTTWYKKDAVKPIDIICDTIDDFLADFEYRMTPEPFQVFCLQLFQYLTQAMLKRMVQKSSRFRIEEANELLKYDHGQLQGIYSKFVKTHDTNEDRAVEQFSKIYPLITSTEKTLLVAFYNFHREFPDVPVSFFEDVISKRDDLDKSIVKSLVGVVKDHVKKTKDVPNGAKKSIFSNLHL